MKNSLELRNVTIRFGGLTAVNDFSMAIPKGSIAGLIGPNGAGKTTAFNVITGFYRPTSGSVYFNDELIGAPPRFTKMQSLLCSLAFLGMGGLLGAGVWKVLDMLALGTYLPFLLVVFATAFGGLFLGTLCLERGKAPHSICKSGIARTFQNIRLFATETVLENVFLGTKVRQKSMWWMPILRWPSWKKEEISMREKCMTLLERLELADVAHQKAGGLPYGAQRRLEIARALATEPSFLLLDEPAAGMNPQESTELMELITSIAKDFDITILLIEHDMKVVMGVCDRIWVLEYGSCIAEGTPEEIRNNKRVIEAYLGEEYVHAQD